MSPTGIDIPQKAIEEFCRRWQVAELCLFGSVLRDDFAADSDVDVLVRFQPRARWSLLELARIEAELGEIVGRPVDLVERQAVESSENYIRRRHILRSAELIYVAR